jgi:hypothetical protein
MGDRITITDNSELDEMIQKIVRQTDYTEKKALQKLEEFNYDYILVIRDYFGIPIQKEEKIKSVNQEIYKQIRYKLNNSINEYNKKNPVDINKVIQNLHQSEENLNNKKSKL